MAGVDELDQALLLTALSNVVRGDFSLRMPTDWTGIAGKIASALNDVIAANQNLSAELARVTRAVGEEAGLAERAVLGGRDVASRATDTPPVVPRSRSEFISTMSHELRTPLNSVLILAGELERNRGQNLTESQVQYASTIRSSGADLLLLLNDILDLSKIESRAVELAITDLTLRELADALDHQFRPVAESQGVALAIELSPGLPPTIATDAGRLGQVLRNLLSNALKFTHHGEVRLRMGVTEHAPDATDRAPGEGHGAIVFSISDTGIGIEEDRQTVIFEAFAQGAGAIPREYGGTGLGLSISRELVRLLGGEITLESSLGIGSTFTVRIPPAPAADAPAPPAAGRASALTPTPEQPATAARGDRSGAPITASETDEHLAGTKILLIEDDFREVLALSSLLQRPDVELIAAEGGARGIETLMQRGDIDLVLVDTAMQDMDGWETIRAISSLPRFAGLPLVALTPPCGPAERERCMGAGACATIARPVEAGQLSAVLSEWLPDRPAPARGGS